MAAQFVVPLLLLVVCTWKGEQRKFGAIVGLASTKPKICCKPKCESVFTLWSVICFKGAAQVRCYRTTRCEDSIGENATPLECCIMDDALSFDSGAETCVACVGVS